MPLAPLHQPNNLAPIRAIRARRPELPQVACFDTSFHRGHTEVAQRFAIPDDLYREGVRRYGFHGLSYEYIAKSLPTVAPAIAGGRVVVAHLGSGASMCAIKGGRSIDSTMGFTALDGLPMGTRSGQIDPGVLLYLLNRNGWDATRLEQFLYQECGLKGLSGVSNDMRDLLASEAPLAMLAVEYFVYRILLETGALAAAMGGIDGFVFTGGIGENAAPVRSRVCRGLAWLGIEFDDEANVRGGPCISRQGIPGLGLGYSDRRRADDRATYARSLPPQGRRLRQGGVGAATTPKVWPDVACAAFPRTGSIAERNWYQ